MSPGNGDCWLPAWLPGYIGFADVGMLENSVSCGAAEGAAKANRCWPVVMGAHHTARRMLRRYLTSGFRLALGQAVYTNEKSAFDLQCR
jgi:hypothetical protein